MIPNFMQGGSMVFLSRSTVQLFTLFLLVLLLNGCASLAPKIQSDYLVKEAEMPFVFIEGDEFQMGNNAISTEQPLHNVSVGDLFVGVFEVTFAQYDRYCSATPHCEKPSDEGWGRKHRPVINVSWDDANAYASWLSEKAGHQFRLPTEAEWEYFARAGTTTDYWPGDSLPSNSANCMDCGSPWDNKMTAPVGSFPANPWGIYNTLGNVVEWVQDDATDNYVEANKDGSARVIPDSTRKIQRGGAWDYPKSDLRSAYRDSRKAGARTNDAGFRLVLIPEEGFSKN